MQSWVTALIIVIVLVVVITVVILVRYRIPAQYRSNSSLSPEDPDPSSSNQSDDPNRTYYSANLTREVPLSSASDSEESTEEYRTRYMKNMQDNLRPEYTDVNQYNDLQEHQDGTPLARMWEQSFIAKDGKLH